MSGSGFLFETEVFETEQSFHAEQTFEVEHDIHMEQNFEVEFDSFQIGGSAEPYEGEYAVTPTVEGQKLKTANKYMSDDLTIEAIPAYEVSNDSGGQTFYIAKG